MTLPQLQQKAREKYRSIVLSSSWDEKDKIMDALIASAFQTGKDAAVGHIENHSEEVIEGLFYVSRNHLEAARNAE